MRKVNLTMEEMDKYSTIKKLIEADGNIIIAMKKCVAYQRKSNLLMR